MKYYEKKFGIGGELFFGRIEDPDFDLNFYIEHGKLDKNKNRHCLSVEEAVKLYDVLTELLSDERESEQ